MSAADSHEDLSRGQTAKLPSERSFAIVFTVVFVIVALFPLIDGRPPRLWSLAVAGGFLAAGMLFPAILAPLNRLWFRLGLLMHKIVSPIILGLLFILALMPVALALRICRKELIPLKFDPEATSYWIERIPPGPPQDSMTRQF